MPKIYEDHNGIVVLSDERDPADKGHVYRIVETDGGNSVGEIQFQKGPIKEFGINGFQNEHILAILINRTKILDEKFPCEENKQAIQNMQAALDVFNKRTQDRLKRQVEGTNQA